MVDLGRIRRENMIRIYCKKKQVKKNCLRKDGHPGLVCFAQTLFPMPGQSPSAFNRMVEVTRPLPSLERAHMLLPIIASCGTLG